MDYEVCEICGYNVLIPWSSLESNIARFDLKPDMVICTEECYHEGVMAEAEYRHDSLTDR